MAIRPKKGSEQKNLILHIALDICSAAEAVGCKAQLLHCRDVLLIGSTALDSLYERRKIGTATTRRQESMRRRRGEWRRKTKRQILGEMREERRRGRRGSPGNGGVSRRTVDVSTVDRCSLNNNRHKNTSSNTDTQIESHSQKHTDMRWR